MHLSLIQSPPEIRHDFHDGEPFAASLSCTKFAHQNNEVLLMIESPLLAAHFTRKMDRLLRRTTGLAPALRSGYSRPLEQAKPSAAGLAIRSQVPSQ